MKIRTAVAATLAFAVLAGCTSSADTDEQVLETEEVISSEEVVPEPEDASAARDAANAVFCDKAAELYASEPPEAGGNNGAAIKELAEIAPSDDLRDDLTTVATYHQDVYVEGDGITDSFDSFPENVQDAAARVDQETRALCGLNDQFPDEAH